MTVPIFITGGSGFVGVHLLRVLKDAGVESVTCLSRRPDEVAARVPPLPGWSYVAGDLCDVASYSPHIQRGAAVVHLASATGRAPASEHQRVNVDGTAALLAASEARGVGRFVYVSSIAAKFRDQRHYPYAWSKCAAERSVRSSGLPHLIVRPTIVLGEGSPVMAGLRKLAAGALAVVFGDGRVRVQPVAVDDLARILFLLATDPDAPVGATLEVGGPEVLDMEELLRRIRRIASGRVGPFLHIPHSPIRWLLAALEPVTKSRLPLTAGQLASFANDGVADRHPWLDKIRPGLQSIDPLLGFSTHNGTI